MIAVYEGVLGGGKTYHGVQHILKYLAGGGRIYTNIEMDRAECEKQCASRYGVKIQWEEQLFSLTPDDIKQLHLKVVGGTPDSATLVVIDELHLYHNARDWAVADRDLLAWLTKSRHLYVDLIFIVQHRNNVDKQWLRLTAGFWRGRDLRKWTIPMVGIKWPFNQFLWCQFDQDGKTLVRREFESIDTSIFKCYKSDQLFEGFGANAGRGLAKVKLEKVRRYKMRKLGLVALVLVLVGSVFLGRKAYARLNPEPMPIVAPAAPSAALVPRLAALPQFFEVEPSCIEWERKGGKDYFSRAHVNGHWTMIPPVLGKRGDWVYIVELADLTDEEKARIEGWAKLPATVTNLPQQRYIPEKGAGARPKPFKLPQGGGDAGWH